jgi:NitT/TauT family transport system substrate-binding protein
MKYGFPGVLTVAATVTTALLSGGCASSNGAAAPPVEKHDVIVGAVPVADGAALYIAQQRGLFQAQGLNVKIETIVSGADAITGQLAGKYDVVLGNYVSYILADALHHDKFRLLAPASADSPNDSMLLVPANSPIQTVAGLEGKTIGVNAPNNIGTVFLDSLLSANAMGVQQDHIHLVTVPFPDMTRALQTHKVDAAWMVEPFVTFAEMSGATPLADTNEGATQNLPLGGYVVTESWEKKYPGTAAAFKRALLQGQEIASRNLPAVWHGVERFAKIPATVAGLIALPSYPLVMQPSELQRVANLMLLYNMLGENYDTNQMLR